MSVLYCTYPSIGAVEARRDETKNGGRLVGHADFGESWKVRILVIAHRLGKQDKSRRVLPKIWQETLAEMIGTTRSRVNFFVNKSKKLGFIEYNGGLHVNGSLLSVVLHD